MTSATARIGKRDIAIAVVLSGLGVLYMVESVRAEDVEVLVGIDGPLPMAFAVPLILLVTAPVAWRRAAPLAAATAALAGLVVNGVLVGTEMLRCGVVLPTAAVLAFTVGAQLDRRDSRLGLGLVLALNVLDLAIEFGAGTAAVMSVHVAALWGIGRIVRSRARMADELRARTAELREARDRRARLEVASDRARLSRELDELLQRRLAELVRLAERGNLRDDAAGAAATLVHIERASRGTLDEMRAVVGLLRGDAAEAPRAPLPTLTHLEALIVRAKGADARLTVEGSPRVLPPAVELSAYRIVEQLLAALEDAPDVEVRVRFGDAALELAVSGPARRRAKATMERARDRARLERGTLEATVRGGRAEAQVSLPVAAAV